MNEGRFCDRLGSSCRKIQSAVPSADDVHDDAAVPSGVWSFGAPRVAALLHVNEPRRLLRVLT